MKFPNTLLLALYRGINFRWGKRQYTECYTTEEGNRIAYI